MVNPRQCTICSKTMFSGVASRVSKEPACLMAKLESIVSLPFSCAVALWVGDSGVSPLSLVIVEMLLFLFVVFVPSFWAFVIYLYTCNYCLFLPELLMI